MGTSRRDILTQQIELINACAATVSAVVGDATIQHEDTNADEQVDGRMVIQGPWGTKTFSLEAKERITEANIKAVIARLRGGRETNPFLMSRYINPAAAAVLREHKINFADAAGNVHLNDPPLFIWQHGFKGETTTHRSTRLFQVVGLKILSVLLWKPETVNATYRELADQAGVSLGAIVPVFDDLVKGGFLHTNKNERRLTRHRELLDQWVLGYAGQLFPRLIIKTCRLAANQNFEGLAERLRFARFGDDVLLGGELAAGMTTEYLRATRAAIHIDAGAAATWMKTLRLVPDPDGNVDFIERFASGNKWEAPPAGLQGIPCANPVLIYGELLRLGTDDRLRETAEMVFEKFIAPKFGEGA